MQIYNKAQLTIKAKKLEVVRDTLEKVMRLSKVLKFISTNAVLKNSLALKGGTAINLIFFNLPRLSVDIDLDFCINSTKEEMLLYRSKITNLIFKFMFSQEYSLSDKSRNYHSLDSFVFNYLNSANMKDNIKIEINYSLRNHILPITKFELKNDIIDDIFDVNTVNPVEIYASKTVALLTRSAPRDLYDLNHMIRNNFISNEKIELYRKCVIFYLGIATEKPVMEIKFNSVDKITMHNVFTSLIPVIRDKDSFKLHDAKNIVKTFLRNTICINNDEMEFLKQLKDCKYRPELLFENTDYLKNIIEHPMAIWKIRKK